MTIEMPQIDVRGFSCPEPLILTRKALDRNPAGIIVLLDNATVKDNVARFAKILGYETKIRKSNKEYLITLSR